MASFGEELQRQRELRGISLREISDATKINIRFLEALEQNDFKHLPGGQFNKGFIRAYAQHIGVNPEEMVDSYLLELRRQEEELKSGRAAAPRARMDAADKRALVALIVAGILLIGLVAGAWFVIKSVRARWHARAESSAASASAAHRGTASPSRSGRSSRRETSSEASAPAPGSTPTGVRPSVPANASSGQDSPAAADDHTGSPDSGGAAASGGGAGGATPSDARPPAGTSESAGPLALRVIPLQAVRFELLCDGRQSFSDLLEPGRSLTFDCAGVYEISIADAGAVNLAVNGERVYLGRPGQSIAGRHVSAANYPDFLKPPYEAAPK